MNAPSHPAKKQSIIITYVTGFCSLTLFLMWGIHAGMADRFFYIEYLPSILPLLPVCYLSIQEQKKQKPPLRTTMRSAFQMIAGTQEEELHALSEAELLSELNQMKDRSYAELYHEMRTPLTVISVNAQLAARTLESGIVDEETIMDIKIISSEASRLSQMVACLSGLGEKRTGTWCASLSLDELIKITARTYQILSVRYGNTLTAETGPDLPSIPGNADRLTQVLVNLINNANRHTRNGTITITAQSLADSVEVSVTDNGEGIASELLPHVFERYCKGDGGGTGLGLTICKKIIDEHGGLIGIESEAGAGTRVWFTLPYKK